MYIADMELEPIIQRQVPFAEPAGALRAANLDELPGTRQGRHEHGDGALSMNRVGNALGLEGGEKSCVRVRVLEGFV